MSEEKKDVNLEDEEGKGAEDQTKQTETGEEKGTEAKVDETKPTDKTFTQDQVNKMMTKEKKQGRSAALKDLGIDPNDAKMVAMVKALIESQKTDEQKQAEQQSEEATKLAEANQRALTAEAKAEAMQLGVKTQFVDDVVTLVLAKMTEDADLRTLIGELKTKYPVWFGDSEEDDKKQVGQKGTGSSVKVSGKDSKTEEKGLGARLAAQRKVVTKKTSFWGK